mgnify:CR=1 FL=1
MRFYRIETRLRNSLTNLRHFSLSNVKINHIYSSIICIWVFRLVVMWQLKFLLLHLTLNDTAVGKLPGVKNSDFSALFSGNLESWLERLKQLWVKYTFRISTNYVVVVVTKANFSSQLSLDCFTANGIYEYEELCL